MRSWTEQSPEASKFRVGGGDFPSMALTFNGRTSSSLPHNHSPNGFSTAGFHFVACSDLCFDTLSLLFYCFLNRKIGVLDLSASYDAVGIIVVIALRNRHDILIPIIELCSHFTRRRRAKDSYDRSNRYHNLSRLSRFSQCTSPPVGSLQLV